MPELPETETIARDLNAMIAGACIVGVRVAKPDVLREVNARTLAKRLANATILRAWRRAKLVVLSVTSATQGDPAHEAEWHVVVQPRFTGGLIVDDGSLPKEERAYVAVTFELADGRAVHYRDVRRLGTVALMSPERFAAYTGALGVEPLDPAFRDTDFSALLRSSRLPIKKLLMDQRRLAGVGNIYANEALWRAGIDPSRESRNLTDAEASALHAALRDTLAASIEARGTSFRDYRDARGERGRFIEQLAAYGRADQPCLRCNRRLVGTHAVDGRSTVFCAHCQR